MRDVEISAALYIHTYMKDIYTNILCLYLKIVVYHTLFKYLIYRSGTYKLIHREFHANSSRVTVSDILRNYL